jgi:hypothetical protein
MLLLPFTAACAQETQIGSRREGLANPTPPESPALLRDVHLVESGAFTRPAIPPLRTTLDGRLAIDLKKWNPASVGLYLFAPEKLDARWSARPDGVSVLAHTTPRTVPVAELYGGVYAPADQMNHRTLCDAWPIATPQQNPYVCASDPTKDCYDVTVVSTYRFVDADGRKKQQLYGKPIRVEVANPKTATAYIQSVITDEAILGQGLHIGPAFDVDSMLEPMITRDGRLLVMRLGDTRMDWTDPDDSTHVRPNELVDIVYSVYAETEVPCDVARWTALNPISHAPYDDLNHMRARYGLAEYPFRDAEGNFIEDGADLGGAYPWVDRDGDNLFFTLVSSTLFYEDATGAVARRYADRCLDGSDPAAGTCTDPATPADLAAAENREQFRGFAFAGLWSHGKVVLLDNITNNIDYGLPRSDSGQRLLELYTSVLGAPVQVRAGTGRDNGTGARPSGATENTAFIDSWENLFNHNPNAVPGTVRDVVWILNTGKASTEVAFDDYLDPDAFIVAEMAAAWRHTPPWIGTNQGTYGDGFVQTGEAAGTGFGGEIRIENAATAVTTRWVIPSYGVVEGGARIEPVALGGIVGKGLWLDGIDDRVRYTIAPQPTRPSPWYASLFVDPRFDDDGQARVLLSFPDGSHIELVGLDEVGYRRANGALATTIPLGGLALARGAWTHLAFVVRDGGRRVDLYVNGFPLSTWADPVIKLFATFSPTQSGSLLVGPPTGAMGFRGWIDEFKLLAHEPGGPEIACNHARGTLVELMPGADPIWDAVAGLYPSGAHDALVGRLAAAPSTRYACAHDYSVEQESYPLLDHLPALSISVRRALNFPEGPLHFGAARPNTTGNRFCQSCHVAGQRASLSPDALANTGVALELDLRRQPMQAPRLIFGNIPPSLFGAGLPASELDAAPTGEPTDRYLAP